MFDTKTDRLADCGQASQVLIGLALAGGKALIQNVDCGEEARSCIRKANRLHPQLCGSRAGDQDSLVFAPYLLLCRVGGPLDTDMAEVIETKSNRAATKIERVVETSMRKHVTIKLSRLLLLRDWTAQPIAPLRLDS